MSIKEREAADFAASEAELADSLVTLATLETMDPSSKLLSSAPLTPLTSLISLEPDGATLLVLLLPPNKDERKPLPPLLPSLLLPLAPVEALD